MFFPIKSDFFELLKFEARRVRYTLVSFDNSAPNLNILLNYTVYNPGVFCKYHGVLVDTNLSFTILYQK